jgi:predicted RNase H-like HicB family nuclease
MNKSRGETHMPSVQMNFNLKCLVRYDQEAAVFVSHCPGLQIYSQGETAEEAHAAITSAVTMYLEGAYDFDRLDQVLRRAGFRPVPPGQPLPSEFIEARTDDAQEISISVPMTLLISTASSECLQ